MASKEILALFRFMYSEHKRQRHLAEEAENIENALESDRVTERDNFKTDICCCLISFWVTFYRRL